mmetsp:Transcript_35052/g.76842  ORF Transcript_35052/g.76842 Transcript_35052/m.76842 type:complete len:118 (-) Transcript_35052:851-1204(-)
MSSQQSAPRSPTSLTVLLSPAPTHVTSPPLSPVRYRQQAALSADIFPVPSAACSSMALVSVSKNSTAPAAKSNSSNGCATVRYPAIGPIIIRGSLRPYHQPLLHIPVGYLFQSLCRP